MKLSTALRLAILTYYFNRSRQYEIKLTQIADKYINVSEPSGFDWKKGADLDMIASAARESGLSFQACAGTFWFIRNLPNGKFTTYLTNKEIFPLFEKV